MRRVAAFICVWGPCRWGCLIIGATTPIRKTSGSVVVVATVVIGVVVV